MKHLNIKAAKKHLCSLIKRANPNKDWDTTDDGRIVIFSDLYIWSDGSIHDESEKEDNFPEIFQEIFFKDDGSISSVVTS